MSRKTNLRRLNVLVTAQTLYNLDRLAKMEGDRNIGRAIDKLTREKMMRLNPHRCATCGKPKPIVCTVDGAPWCEACFDRALGLGRKVGNEDPSGI